MNHDEMLKRIARLTDDVLPVAEQADVFCHLGECEECRTQYMMMMRVNRAVRQMPVTEIPAALDARFAALGTVPVLHRTVRLSSVVLSAGAVLMMLTMSYLFGTIQESQLLAQYRSMGSATVNTTSIR